MAQFQFNSVEISAISVSLPQEKVQNLATSHFAQEDIQKTIKITGVQSRYVSDQNTCTSDLCAHAWEMLHAKFNIPAHTIDGVVFVSQTPDYRIPATACILQHRLGFSDATVAFDVNQGCSGYVYGLAIAASLLESGALKSVALLVGDTVTKFVSPGDIGTALLFGDAGSVTVLRRSENAAPMTFTLGTDGSGSDQLIVRSGAFREPSSQEKPSIKSSIESKDDYLYMNGGEIFNFTLKRVPKLVAQTCLAAELDPDQLDSIIFHQANAFMLAHLSKKLKLPPEKVPLSIAEFGNTSSASIPLTLARHLQNRSDKGPLTVGLFGFGVGYSWGGAIVTVPADFPVMVQIQ